MMIPIEEMTHKELLHTQQQQTTMDDDVMVPSSSSSSSPSSLATAAIENSLKRFSEMQSGRTKLLEGTVPVPRHRRMITFDAASKSKSPTTASSGLKKRPRPASTSTSTSSESSSRSSTGSSFDMSTFEQASNEVQDSLWFPTIEWPTTICEEDDDDDDSNDDDTSSSTARSLMSKSRKRICRGLVRSSSTIDLSSFLASGTRTRRARTVAAAVAVDTSCCC